MLYYFADDETDEIVAWRLIHLDQLRAQWHEGKVPIKYTDLPNAGGKTGFRAIDTRSFIHGVQIAKHVDAGWVKRLKRSA